MGHRRGQFYMTHTLPPHNGTCNLNATLLADNAFISDTTILAAITFKIFIRSKDLLVKKTVTFASLSAIIDGFRLGHFAMRPLFDPIRRSQLNAYDIKFFGNSGFRFVIIHYFLDYPVYFSIPHPEPDREDYSKAR